MITDILSKWKIVNGSNKYCYRFYMNVYLKTKGILYKIGMKNR